MTLYENLINSVLIIISLVNEGCMIFIVNSCMRAQKFPCHIFSVTHRNVSSVIPTPVLVARASFFFRASERGLIPLGIIYYFILHSR